MHARCARWPPQGFADPAPSKLLAAPQAVSSLTHYSASQSHNSQLRCKPLVRRTGWMWEEVVLLQNWVPGICCPLPPCHQPVPRFQAPTHTPSQQVSECHVPRMPGPLQHLTQTLQQFHETAFVLFRWGEGGESQRPAPGVALPWSYPVCASAGLKHLKPCRQRGNKRDRESAISKMKELRVNRHKVSD